MKKGKTILLMCFSVILILSLSSCDRKEKKEAPEEAVSVTMKALKDLDLKTLFKHVDINKLLDSNLGIDPNLEIETDHLDFVDYEDIAKAYLNKLDYKVLSTETDGDTAKVSVEITAIDMNKLFDAYRIKSSQWSIEEDNASIINEQRKQLALDLLKDDKTEKTTMKADISLKETSSGWKLTVDEPLLNALSGGLIEKLKDQHPRAH